MDKLLREENMDLKLTPYKVLATGPDNGLLEFVRDSQPLAAILAEYNGNLLQFLRERRATNGGSGDVSSALGVDPSVMDNYIKSCAGYCVITYLLGIGDRHLDNLLLSDDGMICVKLRKRNNVADRIASGKLFHVDFGFILGRDPKPFPPPMKLCKEMVDAMGMFVQEAICARVHKFYTHTCCTQAAISRFISNGSSPCATQHLWCCEGNPS